MAQSISVHLRGVRSLRNNWVLSQTFPTISGQEKILEEYDSSLLNQIKRAINHIPNRSNWILFSDLLFGRSGEGSNLFGEVNKIEEPEKNTAVDYTSHYCRGGQHTSSFPPPRRPFLDLKEIFHKLAENHPKSSMKAFADSYTSLQV